MTPVNGDEWDSSIYAYLHCIDSMIQRNMHDFVNKTTFLVVPILHVVRITRPRKKRTNKRHSRSKVRIKTISCSSLLYLTVTVSDSNFNWPLDALYLYVCTMHSSVAIWSRRRVYWFGIAAKPPNMSPLLLIAANWMEIKRFSAVYCGLKIDFSDWMNTKVSQVSNQSACLPTRAATIKTTTTTYKTSTNRP